MAYERIIKEHDSLSIPIGQQATDEFKILSQASDYEPVFGEEGYRAIVYRAGHTCFRLQLQPLDVLLLKLESGIGFILLENVPLMATQIEIQLPETKIFESSTFTLTAYFRTRATKAASTPTTIDYRVDCLSTKRQITDWTTVSTPAANNDITITATENKILNDSNIAEIKQITVRVDSGLSTQLVKPVRWRVENLQGIQ